MADVAADRPPAAEQEEARPPSSTAAVAEEDEEEEEGDVCRICRNPGDDEHPLRYPCACSGSIKFVHQDCLLQWLDHSNSRQCEVRNPRFAFMGRGGLGVCLDSAVESIDWMIIRCICSIISGEFLRCCM
ncbi:Os06g0639100 [Oryza sativa Japonica Group]|uniref:RING-type E3 ubiquitin transferase n=2 Tax=Oryza sativa subsp. japonica TaxID=39947 RepID=Q67WI7_ORYSJ|nr:zinc finger (C3HC4-type RING finger)protein-like [Oryza sativa Japonica Group]BAD37530.1 zinc finger (C3HC4-type RING finger)protein-like [Oryza sativa Japonica Group]BAS98791.1 Os06g0639100 [Oryza sativa Japonica Group]